MAETYFIMWRMTQDQKYREAAWQLIEAIEDHCLYYISYKKTDGFASIKRIDQSPTIKLDIVPPHFLSGTLKYLYLIFSNGDELFSLNKWVFNSAGHVFPIGAAN